MSRTYRKIGDYQLDCLHKEFVWESGNLVVIKKEPNKKDLAVAQSDGGNWNAYLTKKSHHWYWNQVSRKRRRVEKRQSHKFYVAEDFEDVDYDDSEAEAKRKGILWEIY